MNQLDFRIIQPHSRDYEKMIDLRMIVLLEPIGIPRTYIDPIKEAEDTLISVYHSNEIVGCCILTRLEDKMVQLRQMAVLNELQGTGIGRSMLIYAEKTALEMGTEKVILHARDAVIPFYLKCKYQIVGDGFTEVNIPHHKMEKQM
jgi:N-acetylglutamate synthase-like GNAT family acetyltransferase